MGTTHQTLPFGIKSFLVLSLVACCLGDEDLANHLLLFDSLPDGLSSYKSVPLNIRTNFSGSVQLVESRDFRVVVNITAPTLQQAYEVQAELFARHGAAVLEIKESKTSATAINLTWLFIGIGVASILVGIFTAVHAVKWYNHEKQKYDFFDHKSYASSSQRGGVYRSGNHIPMVLLPPGGGSGGDIHRGDEDDNMRNVRRDEELRQVQEMPEEEEAEALEMEQLSKLKLQEPVISAENEDSDPQERNLIKSRFHSQAKLVHKELIKKANAGRKAAPHRRVTQNGTYEGVPTDQEETSNDELEDREKSLRRGGSRDTKAGYIMADLQVKLEGAKSGSNGKLTTFGKGPEKPLNVDSSGDTSNADDTSETDPMLLVLADVHKMNPSKTEVISISKDKPAKPGNIYVSPSEMKPVVMSTFGPAVTSTPKSGTNLRNSSPAATPVVPAHAGEEAASTADDIYQDVAKKYQTEGPWFTTGFATMGEIPEDPREDEQSAVSSSAKSASMYGSSEIFDANDAGNTYYNLDSDFDVPPLDPEDILSDGGLPSPLGFPRYKAGDKGKVNDDIKLIPGALKSPGPNTNRMVGILKPRPYSSIILRGKSSQDSSDLNSSNTSAGNVSEMSPPLPPPPETKAQPQQPDTVFEFPPPPKFYKPPHHVAWRENSGVDSKEGGGEYVQIKQPGMEGKSRELATPPKTKPKPGGGGRGSPLNPTYMNVTILSTLCILSLASGVYSKIGKDETRVDITVFAPKHFMTNTTRIFFNFDKDTEIIGAEDTGVLVYDVFKPLGNKNGQGYKSCSNTTCDQGCDETTGRCICFKGYKLNDHGECEDVNECREGRAKCDMAAGCYNRKGSYDCICGEDFYGNGKSCRECKQECPEKHYEVQPCAPEIKKICKACTHSCRSGYYMAQPCTSHENAICRVCQSECLAGQFESRQCTNHHDRECRNSSLLTPPETSKNVIMEDRRHVQSDWAKLDKLPSHYVGFTRYKLHRGTGIYLELTVRFIDAAQQFLPVNTSQPYSLDMMAPAILKSYAVQRYCPNPMPDYYILRYRKHEGLTYKQNDNGTIEACETHKQYGDFLPSLSGSVRSFICSQPGSLTNIFTMDDNFFLARTRWVDKSKRCQRNSQSCETCTRKCGTDMFSGDPTCSVAGDDSDNGVSPRLMMCYNCCVRRNCSADCKEYHKRKCQPEQCSKGNLLEFSLEPSWDSSQDGRFFCHIEPLARQYLLQLDYNVRAETTDAPLHTNTILIYGDEMWEKTGYMEHSDGILDISINSSLGTPPNFLDGATAMESTVFKVGTYKGHGAEFGTSKISPDFVFLRPPVPHGVPPMPKAHQDCTHTSLNSMLLASVMEFPYIRDPRLEAVANYTVPFTVTNKDAEPLVLATLSRNTPVLRKLFSPTILDKKSFSGDITQNSSHWVVTVSGEVIKCPGYLHIELRDPNYPSEVLFDCDTTVLCPTTFSLTFALPSSDKLGLYKDMEVIIEDDRKVHHFRIYRRSTLEEEEEVVEAAAAVIRRDVYTPTDAPMSFSMKEEESNREIESKETPELPLPLPYLLAISGTVLFLIVLAILGLCFQPDLRVPDTPHAKTYHAVFAIGYMMFQFIYSMVVSGTLFFLVLSVLTSHHVNFILEQGQSGAVSTASSHIELLQLQRHLEAEISRQDSVAEQAQELCVEDGRRIVLDLKELHKKLMDATEDVFERHRLDLLLSQQKLHVRQRLTRDLESFRNSYLKAARSVLIQVNQNALASFQNVQHNNTWLDGARFLHEAVTLLRKAHRKELKSFMDWTGIQAELSKLEIDLSFSLPALPRLDDIPAPPSEDPPIKRDTHGVEPEKDPIRSIHMHNNWFFPLEESGMGGSAGYQSMKSDNEEAAKRETSMAFFVFLGLLIFCDMLLLAHRMCKAWIVAKLIVFGFPEYFRERKDDEIGDDDVFESKESKNKLTPVHGCRNSPKFQSVKMFFTQTISSTFFPKIIGAVATCVVLICLLQVSNQYLTVKELGRIGLYHSADQYLDLQTTMTNARLQTHAEYINTVDFPAFQATVSGHISRHRTVLGMYRQHLTGLQNLTADVYCLHLKAIGVTGNCSDTVDSSARKADSERWDTVATITHTCKFHPVKPKFFVRTMDDKIPMSERQVEALLESVRNVIFISSQLVVIYITVIVLKELACAVLWILIQRSGIIRVRIIVEQDQDDTGH